MENDFSSYQEYHYYMTKLDEMKEFKLDSVVQTIVDKFIDRAKKGKSKYGVDLDRKDLSILEWIEHAQDEHMDAILYLEKIKQEIRGKEETK